MRVIVMQMLYPLVTLTIALSGFPAPTTAENVDPYGIMRRYTEACGGLDRLLAENTSYYEGSIKIVGAGLAGTIKEWRKGPRQRREELDLGIVSQITGDNGEFEWEVDANGKVRIIKDESSQKRREVQMRLRLFEHLIPDSGHFSLSCAGLDTAAGKPCYIIETRNNINGDLLVDYIDTSSFLLVKSSYIQPEEELHTWASDYRAVNSYLRPHKLKVQIMPEAAEFEVVIDEYRTDIEIEEALFEPPSQDAADYRFLAGDAAEEIEFRFLSDHIFLDVCIADDTTVWILDNGAGTTVIDSAYAERLGLAFEGRVTGQGAGNVVDFSFVRLPSWSLPGVVFDTQVVASLNIADLKRKAGVDFAGVLGFDFLSRFVARVDYASKTLSLYDPHSFAYSGDGVVVSAPLEEHIHTVPLTVDDSLAGIWRLDMGASMCSFHYRYARDHGLLGRAGIEQLGTGAGGTIVKRLSRFASVNIAGFTLLEPLIAITTSESAGGFTWSDNAGNIGNQLLRNFVLYLDYLNQEVILEEGEDFGKRFAADRSGLQLLVNAAGRTEVYFVAPGTPGSECGLRIGDVILSIDGVPAESVDGLEVIRDLLKVEADAKYQLSILRDTSEFKTEIELRDLFD